MTSMVEVESSIGSWDTIEVRTSSTYSWGLAELGMTSTHSLDMGQVGTPTSTHNWDMARWLDRLL